MSSLILAGRITRIRYRNDENNYTIADLITDDTRAAITVVGILAGIALEDRLRLTGSWETHTRFGEQFRISEYELIFPRPARRFRSISNAWG